MVSVIEVVPKSCVVKLFSTYVLYSQLELVIQKDLVREFERRFSCKVPVVYRFPKSDHRRRTLEEMIGASRFSRSGGVFSTLTVQRPLRERKTKCLRALEEHKEKFKSLKRSSLKSEYMWSRVDSTEEIEDYGGCHAIELSKYLPCYHCYFGGKDTPCMMEVYIVACVWVSAPDESNFELNTYGLRKYNLLDYTDYHVEPFFSPNHLEQHYPNTNVAVWETEFLSKNVFDRLIRK